MELNHRPHIRFRLLYVESEQLNFRRVTRAKTDRAGSAHLYSGARDRHARNLSPRERLYRKRAVAPYLRTLVENVGLAEYRDHESMLSALKRGTSCPLAV